MHLNKINDNAMQLESSVNLFNRGSTKDIVGHESNTVIVKNEQSTKKNRWVIQTKFETPILNFAYQTGSILDNGLDDLVENFKDSIQIGEKRITYPSGALGHGGRTVARGMWHQFGDLPRANEGVYLQVADLPNDWLQGAFGLPFSGSSIVGGSDSFPVKSLAELVGFSQNPIRIGETAQVKKISEAVIAVPFLDDANGRQFFTIPRTDIDHALLPSKQHLVGKSIIDLVEKMQKFILPPSMDFVSYDSIEPFAMYIFDFEHDLSQQDLSYIWQNLSPDIGLSHTEAEVSISHELLAHELLGGGAKLSSTEDGKVLDESAKGNKFDSNIRWMVFKAKQRAASNYYDLIIGKREEEEETSPSTKADIRTKGKSITKTIGKVKESQDAQKDKVTYNWPYDFFSLVELVKIDAEIELSKIERDEKTKSRRTITIQSDNLADIDLSDATKGLKET